MSSKFSRSYDFPVARYSLLLLVGAIDDDGQIFSHFPVVAVGVLVAIQFVRPERTNPPSDPAASFEAVAKPLQDIASALKRSCYDCHSNQTRWPWYSNVAPISWLVASDVKEGRASLNFSEWTRPRPEGELPGLGEVCETVRSGKMPLRSYLLLHPDARLTAREVAALCSGAAAPEGVDE